MDLIRQARSILGMVALVVALWLAVEWIPALRRVGPPRAGYNDMTMIDPDETTGVDGRRGIADLRHDDIIAYRSDPEADDDRDVAFAYVVALPGETIRTLDGTLSVDGAPYATTSVPRSLGAVPGVVVPRGHVYVLSDGHRYDSSRLGPIPAHLLLGVVD